MLCFTAIPAVCLQWEHGAESKVSSAEIFWVFEDCECLFCTSILQPESVGQKVQWLSQKVEVTSSFSSMFAWSKMMLDLCCAYFGVTNLWNILQRRQGKPVTKKLLRITEIQREAIGNRWAAQLVTPGYYRALNCLVPFWFCSHHICFPSTPVVCH